MGVHEYLWHFTSAVPQRVAGQSHAYRDTHPDYPSSTDKNRHATFPGPRGTPRVRDTSATTGSQRRTVREHVSDIVSTGAAVWTGSDGKSCQFIIKVKHSETAHNVGAPAQLRAPIAKAG